ncbi:hypothetical protein [Streptomyces sp. NPDC020607]|uniref:hypothetical protein n=1 Tax=Streptomyces sp. NPDC020607 TaxID=3365082 RepID=UPI0037BCDFB8
MSVVPVSREERLTRLRAQLAGGPAASSKGRTPSSRGAALLYGVMLHGAARLRAGLELTDLEAGLVGPLQRLLSEEELRDFGRVYEEESAGRVHVFPDSLASRPVEEGYSAADLFADVPRLHEEVAAQPNVNVVDLDAPGMAAADGAGVAVDSQEFAQGLADYGYGATFVTASAHRVDIQNRQLMQVRLVMDKFYTSAGSDEWSDDEIYWATSSGADGYPPSYSQITSTFGDVNGGETRSFAPNTNLYEGPASNSVICNVQCWEEDSGAPTDLMRTLEEIGNKIRVVAEELKDHAASDEMAGAADFLLFIAGIAYLIETILGIIYDDLVKERTLVFDRAALAAMAAQPGRHYEFLFNGGTFEGIHYLHLKGSAAPNNNNIAQITRKSTGWSTPTLAWPGSKTPDAPALATLNDTLYCAVRGLGNQIFLSRLDAGKWTAFQQVPQLVTRHAPALTAFNGRLYLAYTGTSGNVFVLSSASGTSWSRQVQLPVVSHSSPALAVRDNALHCVYNMGVMFVCTWSSDGTGWAAPQLMLTTVSDRGAALATYQGKLYMAHRDYFTGRVVINTNTSAGWGTPITRGGTTRDAPALGVQGGNLYCALRGGDDRLWLSGLTSPTANWNDFAPVSAAGTTFSAPAITGLGTDELHLVYRSAQ